MKKLLLSFLLIFNFLCARAVFAEVVGESLVKVLKDDSSIIESQPIAQNPRIRTYVYKEDYIYHYIGHYEFQSHIQFEPGETIQTMSMGETGGWEMVPSGNRLFLRPKDQTANTLMTLITNRRLYQFVLEAQKADSINDPDLVIEARFIYPTTDNSSLEIFGESNESLVPDLNKPGNYNFQYSYSGKENIAPVKVFDDGEFTYFEFSRVNSELPAIFYVDNDGYEGLVNYKTSGDYLIVERVTDLFTLRNGADTVCVFNDKIYHRKKEK